MKRVELLARLKSVQQHDLVTGKDITTLMPFMNNRELEQHIERFEQLIEKHGKEAPESSLPANCETH